MLRKLFKKLFKSFGYEIKKCSINEIKGKGTESFSQCGEDLIVDYIFKLRNISLPTYIDVGAHHPYYLNNTALFYQKGCRGVNIEANPHLFQNFNHFRGEDININIGIHDNEGELDFYIMKDSTLSTFSRIDFDSLVRNGKELLQTEKIKFCTIDTVLEKFYNGTFPDFLSIDVEGLDLQIIKSINFSKSAPKVICVEATEYSPFGTGPLKRDIIDYLVSKGYYEYANTNLNAIMVHNEFWFN